MTKPDRPKPKRGQGEGSMWLTPDGRWCVQISAGMVAGVRKRPKKFYATEQEARAGLRKLRAQYHLGQLVDPSKRTIADAVNDWLEQHVRPNLREYSRRAYETSASKYVVPQLGHVKVAALTPSHVSTWLAGLSRAKVKPRARQYAHTTLVTVLEREVSLGILVANVAKRVERPRHERREMVVWSPAHVRAFFERHPAHRLRALVALAVYCGLRQGEILGLRWDDVDFDARQLHVRRQRVKTKAGMVDAPPKTRSGLRTIDLPDLAIAALRLHLKRATREGRGTGYVFVDGDGEPIYPSTLHRQWTEMREAAAVPKVTFHELRHTQATAMLAAGASLRSMQERLGHADASITQRVYHHVMRAEQRSTADLVDAVFGEPPGSHPSVPGRPRVSSARRAKAGKREKNRGSVPVRPRSSPPVK